MPWRALHTSEGQGHSLVSRSLVLQRWPVFTRFKITDSSEEPTIQEEMDGWMDWPETHVAPLAGRIH